MASLVLTSFLLSKDILSQKKKPAPNARWDIQRGADIVAYLELEGKLTDTVTTLGETQMVIYAGPESDRYTIVLETSDVGRGCSIVTEKQERTVNGQVQDLEINRKKLNEFKKYMVLLQNSQLSQEEKKLMRRLLACLPK